jgi:CcmD family protein
MTFLTTLRLRPMVLTMRTLRKAVLALALLAVFVQPVLAQAGSEPEGLGRPYVHVFLAYAITIVAILGWTVSISRRLGRIERSLQSRDG